MVIDRPIASDAVYPNSRSALLFQLVMMLLRSLLMIASSEQSTMALSSALAS